jgi:hypothetical protein
LVASPAADVDNRPHFPLTKDEFAMTPPRPTSFRHRLVTAAGLAAGGGVCLAGFLVAGTFTSSAPAAPQDCPPIVGCPTVTVPIVSVTVTAPTLPTTTPAGSTTTSTPSGTTLGSQTTTPTTTTTPNGATAFKPKASVRVRGRGAGRFVEIRVTLTKAARLNAQLIRNRNSIARKLFTAKAGRHVFRLRIARTAKPGLASLSLHYRAATGEAAHTKHRLRLPR